MILDKNPSIVWVITTSVNLYSTEQPLTPIICDDTYEIRKTEYIRGISAILSFRKPTEKCIIIENNGLASSYLDQFRDEENHVYIHSTKNQFLKDCCNKGKKELMDIQSCISHFGIQENNVLIKVTGRYLMLNDEFPQIVRENLLHYDAFFRAGSAFHSSQPFDQRSLNDCVTGMIALKAHVFMAMSPESFQGSSPVEWYIAKTIQKTVQKERQFIVERLHLQYNESMEV